MTEATGTATIVDLIERACRSHRDRVAVTGIGDTLTYGELWERAQELSTRLASMGVADADLVGLLSPSSSDLVVGIVGILCAGAAWVPLDPSAPRPRLESVVRDSGLMTVVAPEHLHELATDLGVTAVAPTRTAHRANGHPARRPAPTSAAYVIYTSGSTGTPKGVVVEHRTVVEMLLWMVRALEAHPGDRYMGTASPSFDASVPITLFPLLTGGTLVTLGADVGRDPFVLTDELERFRPRVLQTSPATLRMLTEMGWAGDDALDVWTGGERTPPGVIDHVAQRVRTLCNWYGPTEATVQVSMARLRRGDHESPVGVPFEYSPCILLDEDGRATEPGELGEIFITGRSLARGYLNDPIRTAERFVSIEGPLGERVRAYRTGDLARARPDGSLVIVGRADDQLNVQGYRVEPGEIETRLLQHPAVLEAIVVARSVDQSSELQLAAFVRTSDDVSPRSLRDFAAESLPRHMVPAMIEIVETYPVNATDKVDRQRLATMALSTSRGAPPVNEGATELERAILDIFSSVLEAGEVSLDDDFYDLGGSSLRSLRLFMQIDDRLDVRLPLSSIAIASTPRQLAALVEGARLRDAASGPERGEEPHHEWERLLNGIWTAALGLHHISRTDSFFDLGGSRSDAHLMLGELRELYGAEVSIAELEAHPSIKELAIHIMGSTERSVLVPLMTTGDRTPIFLVAGAGGLAISFLPLARLLGPDQPTYGLQARGIERRALPDLTLQGCARRYVRAIREVQPHGPYVIGGYSLGGVVALKMAQRLEAMGEHVALLAIFDTYLSTAMIGRSRSRREERALRPHALPKGAPRLSTVIHLPICGIVPLRGTAQFEVFAGLGELQGIFARRLGPWAGRTTLFLSDDEESKHVEACWAKVLVGEWSRVWVPGEHLGMLELANVRVAASILRSQLHEPLGDDERVVAVLADSHSTMGDPTAVRAD